MLTRTPYRTIPWRLAICAAAPMISSPALSQDADVAWWPSADGAPSAEQATVPTAPTVVPNAAPAQALDGAGDRRGWLFTSRVVDIGWPKVSLPRLRWKAPDADATTEPGPGPIARMTQATRGAMMRTRSAWNSGLERLKLRSPSEATRDGQPGMLARMFGGGQPRRQPETVADAIGHDRPTFR